MARRWLLTATLALAGSMLVNPLTVAAQEDGAPTITLGGTGAKAGERVTVRGEGWSGSDLVYMELCGNAGRNGSSSCDQGHAVLTGVGPDGTFGAIFTVGEPPVPCPCVVKATSQGTQTFATAPLALQGVPVVALEDQTELGQVERSVEITEARLSGSDRWTAWFGAGARRSLIITVKNTGVVDVHDPPLSILAGKGANPTGVVPAPRLGTIEPGGTSTVEVPVTFEAMSFGELTALVSVAGFAEPIQGRATTTTYPRGLIAIAALLVLVFVLRLRKRRRAKARRSVITLPADPPLALGPAPAVAETDHEPRALPLGQPAPRGDVLVLAPNEVLPTSATPLPPVAGERAEAPDEELVVIDLRDDAELTDAEDLLPNPFDYVSDATVAFAVAAASRPLDKRTVQQRREDERRAAEALAIESARAEASEILASAREHAAAVTADAAVKRAAAESLIERSTKGVEELLQLATAKADHLRRQAELVRRESTRAEVGRRVLDENPSVIDLDRDSRAPRHPGTGGLDSAIGRAIHSAFKG